ncbi:Phthiotriol/phenolphthiotriol dimycocerosates methyltransferase [Rosistilla carotiformis]|uniref:Phthiotriol/phenolphthiotriol dimycocerosates methyltransferase n=2 Tax=Rosistilla carotiformis TaxID=2528017 RepID=A0A518JNY8_9BACT|nr:Phthiotriol/phenolphthiotriol dimycocerosates methyltransferase [Rosistilla carotiformis]
MQLEIMDEQKSGKAALPLHSPKHWLRVLFPTSRRRLLERSLCSLDLADRQSVLIVGAGHDPYRSLFSHVKDYTCLDIENVPGVTDVVADATQMPFDDCRFDCVVATECMEHVSNPFKFIEQIDRVLEPGGLAVVTVPFLFHQHGDPYDFWRPTRECLAGFFSTYSKVEIFSLGNRLHVISDLVTTAFAPRRVLFPLRIINHLLARLPGSIQTGANVTTAPTGFMVAARK